MKRRWLQLSGIAIIGIALFIGVFFMMKKWNTPNTPAFQDEFTKQFLNAKAETPKGFHLFESWTFKYTILYPEDYVMVDGNYYRKKAGTSDVPNVENLYLIQKGFSPKENGMIKGIQLFLVPDGTVVLDSRLRGLLRKVNAPEDTKIEEYKDDHKTVYYVENIDGFHADDGSIDEIFYLYGLIADNNSEQALYFSLRNKCFDSDTKHCEIDFEVEKKMGLKMMKSVEFK